MSNRMRPLKPYWWPLPVLVLAGLSPLLPLQEATSGKPEEGIAIRGKVVEVYDGDTITIE